MRSKVLIQINKHCKKNYFPKKNSQLEKKVAQKALKSEVLHSFGETRHSNFLENYRPLPRTHRHNVTARESDKKAAYTYVEKICSKKFKRKKKSTINLFHKWKKNENFPCLNKMLHSKLTKKKDLSLPNQTFHFPHHICVIQLIKRFVVRFSELLFLILNCYLETKTGFVFIQSFKSLFFRTNYNSFMSLLILKLRCLSRATRGTINN